LKRQIPATVALMKIAYISPYFWPESIGSAPYCTDLAVWLRGNGHELSIIAFRPHYPNAKDFAAWQDGARDRESYNGARLQRIATRGRGSGGFRERLASDLAFLCGLLRHGTGRAFADTDVIVAYVPSCLSLFGAAALSWRTGAPVVGVVHDIESGLAAALGIARHGTLLRLMRTVERWAFARAARMIVLSDGMAAELREIGYRGPVTVLPIWSASLPERDLGDGAPVVGYSGNFGKKQNLDQILPLIGMLNERRPDVRVVLRGDGSERKRIEAAIAGMGVANTEFLPLVPAEQMGQSLQSIDLHLVPQAMNVARYALPSKLFTIMAAGRPFVCVAEAGSPLDHLARNSGAGICVQPGDDEALFEGVARLLADRAALGEMGRRGRAFVATHMDRATILQSYEDLITGAAAPSRIPASPRGSETRPVT
jgi:colanic acid biosynthesis glycosyl transferase WcaI